MTDWNVVQPRKEMEIIPQGISLTETDAAFYIRVRSKDRIVCIRVRKEDEEMTSYEEIETTFDSSKWFGVWGTKG